ncbi:AAA family ATPase [Psychroserpens sp. XS_ASV72]|uniref:AAA family ATPase n=1 Tax=Psychroserpens sp. XS_ASV72 TaxID=3241293 RepID=UPI003512AFE9
MEETLKQITHTNPNCLKVVLFGPESTGKSTLAEALSKHFNTVFVEEFSRSYAEQKKEDGEVLTKADVLPIAVGQMQLENERLKKANKILICDTDLLETLVYSKMYYNGFCPEPVKKYAEENTYDLYFLTYIDMPWEADGIRDQPHDRLQQFKTFEAALNHFKKPYVVVKGAFEERLSFCINQINELLNDTH